MTSTPGGGASGANGPPVPPASPAVAGPGGRRSRVGVTVAAVVIVVVVLVAGLYFFYPRPPSSTRSLEEGGFTRGEAVTFVYNGTATFLCTPGMSVMFPGNATAAAAAATTPCEVGNASQSAVVQVPEWVLVPAFAGLSIFGVAALGATATGVPTYNGTPLGVDCGAGGSATACVDHPAYLYSPLFTLVEQHIGATTGYGGLPLGVLPTPAHEHLIDTTRSYPNVPWGTIAVLVFDPNIWPAPATGRCTAVVGSNLSDPTAHCLTSLTNLTAALTTCTTANAHANSNEPIWATLADPCTQVVVPGVSSPGELALLNGNLYIPFAVEPGALASYPS